MSKFIHCITSSTIQSCTTVAAGPWNLVSLKGILTSYPYQGVHEKFHPQNNPLAIEHMKARHWKVWVWGRESLWSPSPHPHFDDLSRDSEAECMNLVVVLWWHLFLTCRNSGSVLMRSSQVQEHRNCSKQNNIWVYEFRRFVVPSTFCWNFHFWDSFTLKSVS